MSAVGRSFTGLLRWLQFRWAASGMIRVLWFVASGVEVASVLVGAGLSFTGAATRTVLMLELMI